MDYVKNYWPYALIFTFFAYKFWRTQQVKKALPALKARGAFLLDVRAPMEFNSGHAVGCKNIPLGELSARMSEIPRGVPIIVCCASGTRSGMAKALLARHGFNDVHNAGPWTTLQTKTE